MFSKNVKYLVIVIMIIKIIHAKEVGQAAFEFQIVINKTDAFKMLNGFQIQIPEECANSSFCENIPNYPEEAMMEIMKIGHIRTELARLGNFYENRTVHEGESEFLCDVERKVFIPLAVMDETGQWVLVVNSRKWGLHSAQIFTVEMCSQAEPNNSRCPSMGIQPINYELSCMQLYLHKKVLVYDQRNYIVREMPRPIPCCCECREYSIVV